MTKRRAALVDTDARRRAGISHALYGDGWHVEPHESVQELSGAPPASGLLLVADEGRLVEEVLGWQAALFLPHPLIAFGLSADPQRLVTIVRQGARGYLVWPFTAAQLEAAADSAARSFAPGERRNPLTALTPREREVLEAAASGMTSRTIGAQLAISRRTVDAHRLNLLNKIGVGSMAEAVRLARADLSRARG